MQNASQFWGVIYEELEGDINMSKLPAGQMANPLKNRDCQRGEIGIFWNHEN